MAGAAPAAELPSTLPPGFRFHPTDQELINSYLSHKVLGRHLQLNFIPEVYLYSYEPSELPDKSFSPSRGKDGLGAKVECYFFAPRGRKYPTGSRMARATRAGFWKSTGKDRPVIHHHIVIGMKKTLVYHLGRAPHGMRTDWVMHEYRLHDHNDIQDTYVLCRVFNKNTMTDASDVDKEGMHFVTGGDEEDKGVTMLLVNGGAGADKDGMQPMSCSTDEDEGVMQFLTGGVDVDKDGLQLMPDGADADNGGMEFMSGGVDVDKGDVQLMHGLLDTDNDGMQPLSRDANAGNSCMQIISDFDWYTRALAEEDNSWMRFFDNV